MLHNMVHDQLPIDEIASLLGAQLLEFCESELFPETMQNSEVASSSNCCYEEQSSYQTHPSMTIDMNKYNNSNNNSIDNEIKQVFPNSTDPATPVTMPTNNNNMSVIFDTNNQLDNDISASIDFSPLSISFPHHQYLNQNTSQESFDISSLNNTLPLGDLSNGSLQYERHQGLTITQQTPGMVPMLGPPSIQTTYEDECGYLSYTCLRTSMDPMFGSNLNSGSMSGPPFCSESSAGISGGPSVMHANGLCNQDIDFEGDNGLFLPDTMPRVFNSDLQALSNESQHLVHGCASSGTLSTENSNLEDPTFKVGKLSVEERKRKIHRYMKKRNERNFSKKIKYACRKTLADSRPRVRGRFAKNDEQGEMARTNGSNNEYDTDEDVSLYSNPTSQYQRKVGVKEEENIDSSDIFAHISGVNSFKCNYPIQSWI